LYKQVVGKFTNEVWSKYTNELIDKKLINNTMRSILFLIFLSCLTPVCCQTKDINKSFWLSGGLGSYSSGDYAGVSLSASLNFSQIKPIQTSDGTIYARTNLQFRFIYNTAHLGEDNFENLNEFGLLYGKSFGKVIQFAIAGGLGVVSGYKEITYINPKIPANVENSLTLGIPLELGINFIPGKHFGLGIDGFGDINSKNIISGLMFKLLLGKIR
jgi:hypothetical protein